ncbi:MAG TPA: hypothetical protein VHB20_16570 [Verrucomicrobiae bacterium]|jgi:hypothetical protein|nr:hypothetical protein [Verrucomicrobiae bacterium]
MAYTKELKRLEQRRRELAAHNDHLRRQFGERAGELTDSSFWVQRGWDLALGLFANHSVLTGILGFFRK